ALLTKTVTATLPAALLVVFWWKRGRLEWRRDVRPLLPWFALGAIAGLFTAHFERALIGAQGGDFVLGAVQRLLLAGRVFWFYLGKLAWPADLMFIYPHWTIDPSASSSWLFLLAALASLTAAVVAAVRDRRFRAPLAAGLLFAGALFPVLGFLNVYPFVFSYVADHFQYLASLPVFALVSAGLAGARAPALVRGGAAVGLLAVLGGLSRSQCRMYRDATTLYETTLRQNPDCWLAAHNLAILRAGSGRVPEAISLEQKVLQLHPDYAPAENNLGDDLMRLGRTGEAIPDFERAIRLQPDYAVAHRNLGMALAMTDRVAAALPHFELAAQLDSGDAEAQLDWAMALLQTGHAADALPHFARALALNPKSAETQLAFAQALRQLGRIDEAQQHALEARRLQPAP
ncbi:MAG TPA: tetratricopeptide repeat protein, partial [Opitutus sp.]|nr:tetratricopeptide repeat protein [Opitutus sp.]